MQVKRLLLGVAFATVATAIEVVALVGLNHVTAPKLPPKPARRAIPMAAPTTSTPPPPPPDAPVQPEVAANVLPALAPLTPTSPAPLSSDLPPLGVELPALGTGGLALAQGTGSLANAGQPLKTPRGETRPARAIRRPPPRYPARAAARGLEGEVVVRVAIDETGRVSAASVVRATPAGIFDDAALLAAKAYRFQPALKDGRPVSSTVEQRLLFRVPK